jgi:alkane 1-monooxygenase
MTTLPSVFGREVRDLLSALQFTLPIWLIVSVPQISHSDFTVLLLATAVIFLNPVVLDLLSGKRVEPSPDLGWAHPLYALIPRLAAMKLLAVVVFMLWITFARALSPWDAAVLGLLTGLLHGTVAIVVAHELMHRVPLTDRWLAQCLMFAVSYPHFCIEHVHGHHRNVATPDDPATAREGEGLYAFLLRAIPGGLAGAWTIERRRLSKSTRPPRAWRNAVLWQGVVLIAAYLGLGALGGAPLVLAFLIQGLVAILLLETINYVQHYGMRRHRLPNGRYEPVSARHSWNWAQRFSNFYLLNLGRHSAHHARPGIPYQALPHAPTAPQLPGGMMAMVALAFVPPLWIRIVKPHLDAVRAAHGGDQSPIRSTAAKAGLDDKTNALAPQSWSDRWGGACLFFTLGLIAFLSEWTPLVGNVVLIALTLVIWACHRLIERRARRRRSFPSGI